MVQIAVPEGSTLYAYEEETGAWKVYSLHKQSWQPCRPAPALRATHLPKNTQLFALDLQKPDKWWYVNHGGDWQLMQNPLKQIEETRAMVDKIATPSSLLVLADLRRKAAIRNDAKLEFAMILQEEAEKVRDNPAALAMVIRIAERVLLS